MLAWSSSDMYGWHENSKPSNNNFQNSIYPPNPLNPKAHTYVTLEVHATALWRTAYVCDIGP